MSDDLKISTYDELRAELMDVSLESINIQDLLTEANVALKKVEVSDGVSKEMAEPFKNVLPEHINSYTKNPSYTNLESFKSSIAKLMKSTLSDFIRNGIKTINATERLLRRKVPNKKFAFKATGMEVGLVETDSKEYTALSESVLISNTVILKEMMEKQDIVYNTLLNQLIDTLEIVNRELGKKDILGNLEQFTNMITDLEGKLLELNKTIREDFSETSTMSDGMGLNSLAKVFEAHIAGLVSSSPNEPFDAKKLINTLSENNQSTTLIKSVSNPYMHISDVTRRKLESIEAEFSKLIELIDIDVDGVGENKVKMFVDSLVQLLDKITSDINFTMNYSISRMEALDECEKYLKILDEYQNA